MNDDDLNEILKKSLDDVLQRIDYFENYFDENFCMTLFIVATTENLIIQTTRALSSYFVGMYEGLVIQKCYNLEGEYQDDYIKKNPNFRKSAYEKIYKRIYGLDDKFIQKYLDKGNIFRS